MQFIVNFVKFWYDFIIGDDWTVAAVVAVTLVLLYLLPHSAFWWLLPLVVIAILGLSLWRAARAE